MLLETASSSSLDIRTRRESWLRHTIVPRTRFGKLILFDKPEMAKQMEAKWPGKGFIYVEGCAGLGLSLALSFLESLLDFDMEEIMG